MSKNINIEYFDKNTKFNLKSELGITNKNFTKKILFQEVYSPNKAESKPVIIAHKNDIKNGVLKLNINKDKLNTTNNAINIIDATTSEAKLKRHKLQKKHLSFDYNASRVPSSSSTNYYHSNVPSNDNHSNLDIKSYFKTNVKQIKSKNFVLNHSSTNKDKDKSNYYAQNKIESKLFNEDNVLKNELNYFNKSYKEFKHTKTRSSSYNTPLVLNSLNQKKIFNSILIGNSSKDLINMQNNGDRVLNTFHQRAVSMNLSNKSKFDNFPPNITEIDTRLIHKENSINQRTIDSLLRNNRLPPESRSCEKINHTTNCNIVKSKLNLKKISLEKEKNKSKKILKQNFKDSINSNTKEIEKIKSKIRDIFKERQNKEKEFTELNLFTKTQMNSVNKRMIRDSINISKLIQSDNQIDIGGSNQLIQSLGNLMKNNFSEKLLDYTNVKALENYYFPYNKEKDHQKLNELAKLFRGGVNKISSRFYEKYENRVNFLHDNRKLPYFNAELEKYTKGDKKENLIDSLTFKDKIERLQHPNIIRPSAFLQLNLTKIKRQEAKDKEEEKEVEQSSNRKRLLSMDERQMNLIGLFMKQLDENTDKDEEMKKFFIYDREKHLENVNFVSGREAETVFSL